MSRGSGVDERMGGRVSAKRCNATTSRLQGGGGHRPTEPTSASSLLLGGPELEFSSSVTFFPIFGLTAVLKILSFPALASGDNC